MKSREMCSRGGNSLRWETKSSYRYRPEGTFHKILRPPGPYDFPGRTGKIVRTRDFCPPYKFSRGPVLVREFRFSLLRVIQWMFATRSACDCDCDGLAHSGWRASCGASSIQSSRWCPHLQRTPSKMWLLQPYRSLGLSTSQISVALSRL